ncbi:hypothetical protein [Francisella adeliensis]|uniref:Uncharacterized protein n=1 Tax=Francisella adeliensis TaxID=2007306 RepID=A0A2Z4XWU2_9GAMM|nr:hypothetical protein [Francisella adeliensis]AXA33176.1 hypothetical protein CDH04_01510 [Francisella adeliensis]MBK2085932.1 hypothetical protein [Francisella adeliensis]MBK2096904.1 hypothetical protein [Francisella adeliensis]QIW11404.1 hypothetical protein FZC43_01510 [Francisella adeliensis]QIW13279.1 hypothetical protein FZC44_01510 [Francisella adeliensis]
MIKLISSSDNWEVCQIEKKSIWREPEAKHFDGFNLSKKKGFFSSENKRYFRRQAIRVVTINEDNSKSLVGTAGASLAGGLLLGGVGMLAGALAGGKKKTIRVGVEFNDGKKIVFEENSKDQPFIAFLKFAEEIQATKTLDF